MKDEISYKVILVNSDNTKDTAVFQSKSKAMKLVTLYHDDKDKIQAYIYQDNQLIYKANKSSGDSGKWYKEELPDT